MPDTSPATTTRKTLRQRREVEILISHGLNEGRTLVTKTHLGTPDLSFVEGGVFAASTPTGRSVSATRTWLRIRDGQIVERWANRDDLGLTRQPGLLDDTPLAP
jgi:predicted ester cyclase